MIVLLYLCLRWLDTLKWGCLSMKNEQSKDMIKKLQIKNGCGGRVHLGALFLQLLWEERGDIKAKLCSLPLVGQQRPYAMLRTGRAYVLCRQQNQSWCSFRCSFRSSQCLFILCVSVEVVGVLLCFPMVV